MVLLGAAIVLGVWSWLRSSSLSALDTAGHGLRTDTVVQTTRTVADQAVEILHGRNQFTAVRIGIPAGGHTGRYKHLAPSLVYILEGTLTLDIDGYKARTFSAGQGFAAGMNIWHDVSNRTTAPARMLVIYIGTDTQRLTMTPGGDATWPPWGHAEPFFGPFDSIVGH